MKKLTYKKVRVEYNDHLAQFEVYYKKWYSLTWRFDSCYQFDRVTSRHPMHYRTLEGAREQAIERAKGMLNHMVVFEESNWDFY